MEPGQAAPLPGGPKSADRPRVFVSGCFDLLHSGHVAFLQTAATYGDLHVAIGSDATVAALKGRRPVCSEAERLFMIRALGCVREALISSGSGVLDFAQELRQILPHRFVVNADGDHPEKQRLCKELGIEYTVLPRQPEPGLPGRSTTSLRQLEDLPYRIDLAGGWLDQPMVSTLHPGPVITVSIEPTFPFDHRSGMATSTRNRARELWGPRLPAGEPEQLARVLFAYDNPPGTDEVSGSQDAIGIVVPGLTHSYYDGDYWPSRITRKTDESVLRFVEESLHLVPLGPRHADYQACQNRRLTAARARALADAAESCWQAVLAQDPIGFGAAMRRSFEAQVELFPNMLNTDHARVIARYDRALGWKLSGAGGGGYLVLVSEVPVPTAIRVRVRRGTL